MGKVSRRIRDKNRSFNYQNDIIQSSQPVAVNKPDAACQSYDATRYIKNDLKWSAVAGGVVFLLLIIAYIFLR
ncbi:MAG: hypothetical protein PHU23_02780 [Dehalococcoidales bacterium]|nr:hypothetical protein [Dehalococcoidales bacterium]